MVKRVTNNLVGVTTKTRGVIYSRAMPRCIMRASAKNFIYDFVRLPFTCIGKISIVHSASYTFTDV